VNGWEATDLALVILAVFAPATLLVIAALLRGYNVKIRLWRDTQKKKHTEMEEDDDRT